MHKPKKSNQHIWFDPFKSVQEHLTEMCAKKRKEKRIGKNTHTHLLLHASAEETVR